MGLFHAVEEDRVEDQNYYDDPGQHQTSIHINNCLVDCRNRIICNIHIAGGAPIQSQIVLHPLLFHYLIFTGFNHKENEQCNAWRLNYRVY